MFLAYSFFRRRKYEQCVNLCTQLLEKNPYDQVLNIYFCLPKGDIVKDPMKSRDVIPKNIPGVEWVMQGWGGSCRGGQGHAGVRWVMKGWGGSYRGRVGHTGVG